MKKILILIVLFSVGCTSMRNFNKLEVGMSELEVKETLGKPRIKSAINNRTVYRYNIGKNFSRCFVVIGWLFGISPPTDYEYFVRFMDGKTDSFGKMGDFDSTKPDTLRIETPDLRR